MASIDSIPMRLGGATNPAHTLPAQARRGPFPVNQLAYNIASGAFALALLIAATLGARSVLTQEVIGSGFGWHRAGELTLAAMEWLLAAWLLSGLASRWSRRAAICLLSAFIFVAGWHLLRGDADCGCFADVKVHPAWTVSFDLLALAAIFWFGRSARGMGVPPMSSSRTMGVPPMSSSPGMGLGPMHRRDADATNMAGTAMPRLILSAALSLSIPAATLFAIAPQNDGSSRPRTVFLDVDSWVGKRCPLFDLLQETPAELLTGSATVVLVDADCRKCREHLARMARPIDGNRICVVDVPAVAGMTEMNLDPAFKSLELRHDVQYAAEVPIEILLRDGVVIAVRHL